MPYGKQIANEDLQLSDVPASDSDREMISRFALSFDGYEFHGSLNACGDIANQRRSETLTDLRTCLFFEQRRWSHFNDDPDPETMQYIRGLLDQIRQKLIERAQ